ncbi:16S rRNA (cytidine(1402)-2'-O)-methyltransferase [Desulfotomaculum sp. 1211_IL3151]|uniref:16S rRNA (cytidine(1402)-2'-O)-methyltransferase n=1 Tax=Desulfotomaculum sp. 1211_IL3151 TaxID=3084055 RepID=UPI002FDB7C1F
MEHKTTGTLYLCATPIGNLEDITLRALRILKEVDCIAAEDTRHTRKLLSHFDIHTPLLSYHSHSSEGKEEQLIMRLKQGENIALVSDAGMPGISDPGADLVRLALEQEIIVVPLPGASAGIAALVASGLPTNKFVFEGFLSNQRKTRRKQLQALKSEQRTMIFYESPHRLTDTLKDMLQELGDRPGVVARELTKVHEEFKRGLLSQLLVHYDNNHPRGEVCLIVGGAAKEELGGEVTNQWAEISLAEHIESLLQQGYDKKEAIKQVAKLRGLPKREVYAVVHKA